MKVKLLKKIRKRFTWFFVDKNPVLIEKNYGITYIPKYRYIRGIDIYKFEGNDALIYCILEFMGKENLFQRRKQKSLNKYCRTHNIEQIKNRIKSS